MATIPEHVFTDKAIGVDKNSLQL